MKDASFSFSRILNSILRSMASTACICLDDATPHTERAKTHLIALRLALEKLGGANARLTPHKCAFLQTKVAALGHKVPHGLVGLGSDKVQAARGLRAPTNRDGLARVYGLLGWARRFLPDFAARAKPLSDLLKGDGRSMGPESMGRATRASIRVPPATPALALRLVLPIHYSWP